jgi:hypothetical protein
MTVMKATITEIWLGIKDIRVDNLVVLREENVIVEKLPLDREYLGDCYLPWYEHGPWAFGGQYTVRDFKDKIRMLDKKCVITIVDNCSGRRVIVDGAHRAVAFYQAKSQKVDGYIILLKTPDADFLFPKDCYWNNPERRSHEG